MTINKQKVEKWARWFEDVQKDVTWVLSETEVYEEFIRVHNENVDYINAHHGGTFCDSIRLWYGFFGGFAVRRHVDASSDKNNHSLRNLLEDIKKVAALFTYDFYLQLFPLDPSDPWVWQEDTFKNFSDDGVCLSADKIQADIDALEPFRKTIADYVDRVWAHLDRRGIANSPDTAPFTYGTIKDGLVLVDKLSCRYLNLFNHGYHSLKPVRAYPWTGIFDVPLREQASR